MKHRNYFLMIVSCLIAMAIPSLAMAQDKNDLYFVLDHFEPMPSQGVNILNMPTSGIIQSLKPSAGLFVDYAHLPLKLENCKKGKIKDGVCTEIDPNGMKRIVDFQVRGDLTLSLGLFDYAEIGVAVPVIYQRGHTNTDGTDDNKLEEFVLGDLRVIPKVRFVKPEWAGGFGAAIMATVYLPLPHIGENNYFNTYYTGKDYTNAIRVEPRLILDWRHDNGFTIGANVAYQWNRRGYSYQATGSLGPSIGETGELRWNVGTRIPLGLDWLNLIGDFFGSYQLGAEDLENVEKAKNALRRSDYLNIPIEYAAALEFKMPYDLVAQVGGGGPIVNDAIGVPKFRFFGSFGYTPTASDMDGDGIPDERDQCPEDPEDIDGWEDRDGCPDPDNDGDGVFDIDDKCPDEPGPLANQGCPWGDRDGDTVMDNVDNCPDDPGPVESQGCPIYDRDGDGIPDDRDRCPDDPEDKDGFQDEDGCPDTDNDNDGIPDVNDKCPLDPEDKDGFEDEDGCPDLDNDGDGIPDDKDKCPNDPETINGIKDDDGCPDKGKSKIRVTETKIEILEKVFFATNKAIIRKRSYGLLNQVAAVLKNYKRITQVRVDGYTDSRGRDSYNLKLSQDRADAVRNYLIEQGVAPDRLIAKGYGEADPIATNETKAGREQNRRVEFTITEINGKPVSTNTITIKEREVVDD